LFIARVTFGEHLRPEGKRSLRAGKIAGAAGHRRRDRDAGNEPGSSGKANVR